MKELTINQLAEYIYSNRNNLNKEFEDKFYASSNVDIRYSNENHILSALYDSEIERYARYAYKHLKIKRK